MKGYAVSNGLSGEPVRLWKEATKLVEIIPDSWAPRAHELVRAVAAALELNFVDGMIGPVEHSWLYIGSEPQFPEDGVGCEYSENCQYEGTHYVQSKVGRMMTYCPYHAHCAAGDTRNPIPRRGVIILDVHFPGAAPPVVLLDCSIGLPFFTQYNVGPYREDIDELMVRRLKERFDQNPHVLQSRPPAITMPPPASK